MSVLPSDETKSTPITEPPVELDIEARTRDLGNGLTVRRLLPSAARRMVGPFIFLDHMGPVQLEAAQGARRRAAPSHLPRRGAGQRSSTVHRARANRLLRAEAVRVQELPVEEVGHRDRADPTATSRHVSLGSPRARELRTPVGTSLQEGLDRIRRPADA
jgi:hypothetical protein